jgi:ABC-2 type transport system permease protein
MPSGLAPTLRKVRAITQAYLALWTEYRAELYLWALSGVLPLILMGVWNQVSKNADFALNPAEFVRYFLAVFVVRQFTVVWVIWEFEELVVQGTLSPLLLQPFNPLWRFLLGHMTERLARLPFVFAILALGFVIYPEALFLPSLADLGVAAVAIFAAFVVRFIIQYTFAMVSFWSERASSIEEVWFLFYLFLSGMVAPLDVYPPSVRAFAELTPFPYMIYMPAQLIVGRPVDLTKGAIVLLIWGVIAWVCYRVLWRYGLRRYSAMGA